MCWLSKRKPVAKIAKRDIPVKKVIFANGTAYFNSFNYKTRKVIPKVEIEVEKVDHSCGSIDYRIHCGYHSYSSRCIFVEICPNTYPKKMKQCISVRNSSKYYPLTVSYYTANYATDKFRRIKVQNFIIPKGTKYYTNEKGEYVSELIKIV